MAFTRLTAPTTFWFGTCCGNLASTVELPTVVACSIGPETNFPLLATSLRSTKLGSFTAMPDVALDSGFVSHLDRLHGASGVLETQ